MTGLPVQPVTVTLAELTAIKTALTDKAASVRRIALSGTGLGGRNSPEAVRERARRYEDLAARLSFARPGEPIQVITDAPDAAVIAGGAS